MELNKSTASNLQGIGDDVTHDTVSGSIPVICSGTTGPSTSRNDKESNVKAIKMHEVSCIVEHNNALYRHTRFTPFFTGDRQYTNRSLPDHASLQNVYFLSGDSESASIQRHYSTGDVRKQRATRDASSTSNFRKWMRTEYGMNPRKLAESDGVEFKLMNYNVLAQDLLTEHSYLYRNHNPPALLWETRWRNLYNEITEHDADIICLQEVQESHIDKYYTQISKLGYGSIFKKRTGYRTDGCALYYRENVFQLIDYITVEYHQPNTTILDRENVAIIAVLASLKDPKSKFVVATTHLLYNPKRQDIRVAQTQILLTEIERMAFKGINEAGVSEYYPIIITGDFNSEPDSAVVELLTKGQLKYDYLTRKSLAKTEGNLINVTGLVGKVLIPPKLRITDHCQHLDLLSHRTAGAILSREEQESLIHLKNSNITEIKDIETPKNQTLFSTGQLSHRFNLKSAFNYRVGNDTEGTTFQDAWITVDYIFYSANWTQGRKKDGKLKLTSRYSIPTTRQLNTVKTIPNFVLGSDHLALVTKFKLEF